MYIGIDLGTSGVKSILIDESQNIIGSSLASLSVSKPCSGWFEQNPADWINATKRTLAELKSLHRSQFSSVKGIGLSGQMHGATLLDKSDDIISPCILWNDTRCHKEASELNQIPDFQDLTGNIVFPGFTAPKLVWLRANKPRDFDNVSMVLLPKDYLRLWLTGEYCSEMSDASGTSWLDVGKRRWSSKLLNYCEMSKDQVPPLVEGSNPSGTLRTQLAQEIGLSSQTIVAGGAGDNAASAIATGTVKSGSAFVSLGTSGVIFAANDTYRPNPKSAVHAFCHAIPNHWHQMGVVLSATAALNWFSSITSMPPQELTKELGDDIKAPSGAMFLPYLAGERTPHNDAKVRGSFHGLGGEMDRSYLTQAVLEGVAFALKDNLQALQQAGTKFEAFTAQGGGSNSDYWLQVIATVLDLPIHVPVDGDFGAAFGAARLGMLAVTSQDPQILCTPAKISRIVRPITELRSSFEDAYGNYKNAYHRQN